MVCFHPTEALHPSKTMKRQSYLILYSHRHLFCFAHSYHFHTRNLLIGMFLISFLIMYFFVGLNTAGQMVQNPFVSLPKNVTIYPTASAISKGSKDVIERIQTYCEKTANGNLPTDSSLYIW